jgi:hypothetical protein
MAEQVFDEPFGVFIVPNLQKTNGPFRGVGFEPAGVVTCIEGFYVLVHRLFHCAFERFEQRVGGGCRTRERLPPYFEL